jgi:hypothetical protein
LRKPRPLWPCCSGYLAEGRRIEVISQEREAAGNVPGCSITPVDGFCLPELNKENADEMVF